MNAAAPSIEVSALARLTPAAAALPAPSQAGSFEAALRRAARSAGDSETLREAATQFVATAFILPILHAVREGSFNDGPLAPGTGEHRFAPLLDQHLADRITTGARFPLVDSIVRHLIAGTPGDGR